VSVVLQRLADLRRRREQRALEALTVQADLLRQAERKAEAAAQSVRDQLHQASVRERELIGALAKCAVSPTAIFRIQMELDGVALETARLRAAAARAQADVSTSQRARADARDTLQMRQRALAKIEHVRKQETARLLRRDEALGDAEGEDHRAASITSPLR
jgi:hypothetical protein